MKVEFSTVEEFLEELRCEVEARAATSTPCILRLACTYTLVQGQVLRVTVVAGVLINQQLLELRQDCGTVWDHPEATATAKACMKPGDEKTQARVIAVRSAIMQFATAHTWGVRKGLFVP
ncbi:MAG: hypothetical protein AB7N91_30955 [Candidatus Tectimicrobiota bacterium]